MPSKYKIKLLYKEQISKIEPKLWLILKDNNSGKSGLAMTSSPYSINMRAESKYLSDTHLHPELSIHSNPALRTVIRFNFVPATLSFPPRVQANNGNGDEWLWAFSH